MYKYNYNNMGNFIGKNNQTITDNQNLELHSIKKFVTSLFDDKNIEEKINIKVIETIVNLLNNTKLETEYFTIYFIVEITDKLKEYIQEDENVFISNNDIKQIIDLLATTINKKCTDNKTLLEEIFNIINKAKIKTEYFIINIRIEPTESY